MVSYLTCEELARLESAYRSAAEGELDGDQARPPGATPSAAPWRAC